MWGLHRGAAGNGDFKVRSPAVFDLPPRAPKLSCVALLSMRSTRRRMRTEKEELEIEAQEELEEFREEMQKKRSEKRKKQEEAQRTKRDQAAERYVAVESGP